MGDNIPSDSDDALLDMLHQAPDFQPDEADAEGSSRSESSGPTYLCSIKGVQEGPFRIEELQALIRQGRLTSTDRLRASDSLCWIPGRELSELVFPEGNGQARLTAGVEAKQRRVNLPITNPEAKSSKDLSSPNAVAAIHSANVQPLIVPETDELNSGNDDDTDFTLAPVKPAPVRVASSASVVARVPADVPKGPAKPLPTKPLPTKPVPAEEIAVIANPPQTSTFSVPAPQFKDSLTASNTPTPAAPRKTTESRTGRNRQPISISVSRTLVGLVAVMLLMGLWLFWPASPKGVFGRIAIDGIPVPIGSLTISPEKGKPISLNVVNGSFESVDDKPFPEGNYMAQLIVGNALGMPLPELENTPFGGLNGARFSKSVQFNSAKGNGFEIDFQTAEAVPLESGEAQPLDTGESQ